MPVTLSMQQLPWDMFRKVSGGHGATLCLEKQSWNSSPGCPDILLLPNDTDETRSSALCVTAVGTVLQPCDMPAQDMPAQDMPASSFSWSREGTGQQPQSKPHLQPQNHPCPQPSLQHCQQSLILFIPFPFFFLFPLNASFLVLSTCTCRAGNLPAHPGWGTRDSSGSAPGHPGRSHQLLLSLKQWEQALAAAPMEIQMFTPGSCQKPDVPGLILTTPPACLPCRPPGFDAAPLLGFRVPPVQWDKKWLSPWGRSPELLKLFPAPAVNVYSAPNW